MDKYYFIYCPIHGDNYKKYTYKQYIATAQHTIDNSFFKVLKTDYNALDKAVKGVNVRNKIAFIFNRLHTAGKTARA